MRPWLTLVAVLAASCGGGTTARTTTETSHANPTPDAGLPDGAAMDLACGFGTCTVDQICYWLATGGVPHDSRNDMSCKDFPAACATDHTCACLKAQGWSLSNCSDGVPVRAVRHVPTP